MKRGNFVFVMMALVLAVAFSGWAQLAMKPPASGVLYDAAIGGPLANKDATAEVIDYEGGKALKMTFGTTANWPQVNILGSWDLSEYTAIEAKITNVGTGNEKLTMRADNPGSTADARWNMAVAYNGIAPGETVTLRIDFGYDNFRSQVKSYDLDKSNVTQVLFSVKKPSQPMSFRLESLRAVK